MPRRFAIRTGRHQYIFSIFVVAETSMVEVFIRLRPRLEGFFCSIIEWWKRTLGLVGSVRSELWRRLRIVAIQ